MLANAACHLSQGLLVAARRYLAPHPSRVLPLPPVCHCAAQRRLRAAVTHVRACTAPTYLSCRQVVTVQRGDAFVSLYPEDNVRLTVGVDGGPAAPVIGKQWVSWCMFQDPHFQ